MILKTFREIADLYRVVYRDQFQPIVYGLSGNDTEIVKLEAKHTPLDGALIILDTTLKFSEEVLGANTIEFHEGKWIATIHLSSAFFRAGSMEERKVVAAHEWLEVAHAIHNQKRDRDRITGSQIDYFTLIHDLGGGIPQEDSLDDWNSYLSVGLRDLLVSRETILQYLAEDSKYDIKTERELQRFYQEKESERSYIIENVANGLGKKSMFLQIWLSGT